MIGCFLIGGLVSFAAIRFFHHRRHGHCGHRGWWRHRGGHFGHGGDFDGGPMPPGGGFSGSGMPFYLRYLSRRLDATPGQERAVAQAAEQFRADVAPLRAELDKTRVDLAAALRKPSFDEVGMGELFARHDEAMEKARRALVGLGARVHDALDERQRDELATMIEKGGAFSHFGRGW